eukprot:TRINITY_DN368_c0_g1_i14.p2 TRINITY_DN368_c0_g1~~TRINITY_DN368_c0_g1_i14.p2  ORF type:complete len:594 (+),score=103.02 TRINITY_DN368_c0_g1_i14:3196-4977(+)
MNDMTQIGTLWDAKNGVIILGNQVFDYVGNKPRLHTVAETLIMPKRGARIELAAFGIDDGDLRVSDQIPLNNVCMECSEADITVVDGISYITVHNWSDRPIRINKDAEIVSVVNSVVNSVEDEEIKDAGRIIYGKQLSKNKIRRLVEIVRKYERMFANKLGPNHYVSSVEHHIRLRPGSVPVRGRVPFLHPDQQKAVQETIKDLLARDMIEPGDCEWRAPLYLVPKKDGGWRTIVDYRGLNKCTIPDVYLMPLIDEILYRLANAKCFTKMDLTEGFWLIRIAKESQGLTGFAVKGGTYVWKRMPMGLKNSPATFQRFMDDILSEFSDFCQLYIDDIIIFSKTFEEHLEHIDKILGRLQERGLIVKLPKCEFCVEKLDFLGHVVSTKGISMQHRKIEAITKMEPPRNETETKRFIAMAGYYRKFIKNFARRTHRMGEIARGKKKFEWTKEHLEEFNDIKKALTSDPVMAYPDWNLQFIVTTDASLEGLGAVLSQKFPEGERVIAYASRRLSDGEKKYAITQLEALAVVWAVKQFRDPYLMSHKFKLVTDHRALLQLQNMNPSSNRTLQRWSMELAEFDMEIVYRPGSELVMLTV